MKLLFGIVPPKVKDIMKSVLQKRYLEKSTIRYTLIYLFFFIFLICQTLIGFCEEQILPEPTNNKLKTYNFSSDWFTRNISLWNKLLHPLKEKPNIHYLEIGSYEGRSAVWMLENILTHSSAKLTGIDIFPGDLKQRYLSNIKKSGSSQKVITITGKSQIELKKLPAESFDIIYIDGSHKADDVLADTVLSWNLLKIGGILIFDDYSWKRNEFPKHLRPEIAIDSFINAYSNHIEIMHKGYQVFLRKKENPCGPFENCSLIGQYIYIWKWNGMNNLYLRVNREHIPLSKKEKDLIEKLARSFKYGQTGLFPNDKLLNDKQFKLLCEKLDLDFSNIKIKKPASK